ncbi:putative F-box domain-containing protein [Medicago truncatula]|uniref:Putative F-box domain-containing protein n=1 Tax=Medicago truncatula TaxID=3880 RepID=A0A396H0U0_MEDTR|nr:putative F-box domain-containing protein [Medicago truncatula]
MDIQTAKKNRPPTVVVLPDDLIAEVLSYLPVKILLQFRCVNKYWKALIFDTVFIKLHLNRSASRDPKFTLVTYHADDMVDYVLDLGYSVVPYSIRRLIENPSFTHSVIDDDCYFLMENYHTIVGSCNGLICLSTFFGEDGYQFRLWNPATRTTKDFAVASRYDPEHHCRSNVKILSLHDNVWRDIESFPVAPLHLDDTELHDRRVNCGVYLSSTLNWLAIHNHLHYNSKNITVEQFVIISLDLGTETYNKYQLPRDFDEVPPEAPTVGVLGGSLCFSYSYKEPDFVIWRMMKFGVEDSWTQFFKISYQDLQIDHDYYMATQLVPLLPYEDGHTLIIKRQYEHAAILYNWRDNKVERTKIIRDSTYDYVCWYSTMDYTESLVSIL